MHTSGLCLLRFLRSQKLQTPQVSDHVLSCQLRKHLNQRTCTNKHKGANILEDKEELKDSEDINEVMIDYSPFFETLEELGISQNQLKEKYDISSQTLHRMHHNTNMTIATCGRFMKILNIDDINKIVRIRYK